MQNPWISRALADAHIADLRREGTTHRLLLPRLGRLGSPPAAAHAGRRIGRRVMEARIWHRHRLPGRWAHRLMTE